MKFTFFEKPKGFLYNIIQKLSILLDIPESSIELSTEGDIFYINIKEDLTEKQENIVNYLMNGDACAPLTSGTTFVVRDLWGMRGWYQKAFGKKLRVWMENDAVDDGECFLYLQFPEELSEKDKQRIYDIYRNSIWEYKK